MLDFLLSQLIKLDEELKKNLIILFSSVDSIQCIWYLVRNILLKTDFSTILNSSNFSYIKTSIL